MRGLLCFCVFAWSLSCLSAVQARPAEKVLRLKTGEERLVLGPGRDWHLHCFAPEVLEARLLKGSGEIVLKALKEGEALLLINNRHSQAAAFWLIKVGTPPPVLRRPDPAPLKKACACETGGKVFLDCKVADAACLDALDAYLQQADLQGEELSLRFELQAVQLLLARMQKALKEAGFGGVELGFLGGALVADGLVKDEAAWQRMMLVVHQHMLGRLSLRDRVKRMDESSKSLSKPF